MRLRARSFHASKIPLATLLICWVCGHPAVPAAGSDEKRESAIIRATAFLGREVPLWLPENDCRSCHHNGDGARALHEALSLGFSAPGNALADSRDWLARPDAWLEQSDVEYADEDLAALQFASGLAAAVETGAIREPATLREAARLLGARQSEIGAYVIEPKEAPGSPVTYGTALATAMALRVWEIDGGKDWEVPRRKARAWLAGLRGPRVLDSAAVLLALGPRPQEYEKEAVARAYALLRRAQLPAGGWGLFPDSPAEPFDTAIVLLAMAALKIPEEDKPIVLRGAGHLIETQETDGGWPATTRPPGGDSYAQRVSTSAWVLLALLSLEPGEEETE